MPNSTDNPRRPLRPMPTSRRAAIRRLLAPALLALLGSVFAIVYQKRFGPHPAMTLAVARFDNRSGDAKLDRFARGLTDAVVQELIKVAGPRYDVEGDASILHTPRERRDLAAIAASLHASYIVTGEVVRTGNHVRVQVRLIRMPEQKEVSVTNVDRFTTDPVKDEPLMARSIAGDLNDRVGPLPPPNIH